MRFAAAPDAASGIALAYERRPDLILMDMDGFSALYRLRAQGRTKSIAVMAVSPNAMTRQMERGGAEGFVACLTKPIAVKSLLGDILSVGRRGGRRWVTFWSRRGKPGTGRKG